MSDTFNPKIGSYPREYDQLERDSDYILKLVNILAWLGERSPAAEKAEPPFPKEIEALLDASRALREQNAKEAIKHLSSLESRFDQGTQGTLSLLTQRFLGLKASQQKTLSLLNANALNEKFEIKRDTANLMYAYIVNREKAVSDPLLKRYYRTIRELALHQQELIGLEMLACFFAHELTLLTKDKDPDIFITALENDIDAVWHILIQLKKNTSLSFGIHGKILQALKKYQKTAFPPIFEEDDTQSDLEQMALQTVNPTSLPAAKSMRYLPPEHVRMGYIFQDSVHFTREISDSIRRDFIKMLHSPEYSIKKIKSVDNNNFDDDRTSFQYFITLKNGETLPPVTYWEREVENGKHIVQIMVDQIQVSQDREGICKILQAYASVYSNHVFDSNVYILAGKDDTVAIELMANATEIGLEPDLHFSEYSDNLPQDKKRKDAIIEKARQLNTVPLPRPRPRV